MGDFSIFAFSLSGGSISSLPGQAIVIEYSGSCLENSSTVRRKAQGVSGNDTNAECGIRNAESKEMKGSVRG